MPVDRPLHHANIEYDAAGARITGRCKPTIPVRSAAVMCGIEMDLSECFYSELSVMINVVLPLLRRRPLDFHETSRSVSDVGIAACNVYVVEDHSSLGSASACQPPDITILPHRRSPEIACACLLGRRALCG